jgi:hypothetical protein
MTEIEEAELTEGQGRALSVIRLRRRIVASKIWSEAAKTIERLWNDHYGARRRTRERT